MVCKTCRKIYKYFNKFVHPWLITKTWQKFLVDDFGKDYKIEKIYIYH